MKQKLSLSLLALALGILPALANEPVFLNAGSVEHLNVQSDMEIVLLQAPADDHSIVLDQEIFEKLNVRLVNKTLFISGRKGEKAIVYLYVSNLKSLTVDGNIQVKTLGALDTKKLDVFVDGNSMVHLRTTGKVKAHSLNDSEIGVKYISRQSEVKRGY